MDQRDGEPWSAEELDALDRPPAAWRSRIHLFLQERSNRPRCDCGVCQRRRESEHD